MTRRDDKQASVLSRPKTWMALCAASLLAMASSAAAEEVTLSMIGTGEILRGELVGFDADSYTVTSAQFGTLRLARSKFNCIRGACPAATSPPKIAALNVGPNFGIHGSNTIGAQLMPALLEAYAESIGAKAIKRVGKEAEEVEYELQGSDGRSLAKVDLQSHGSGTSFPALARGDAQIGMASRPIKDKEQTFMDLAGYLGMRAPGKEHVVALDGLLAIVSPQNPLSSISIEDMAKVFAGEITDWSQLGQSPGPINVYARDDKSGTYDTFNSLVLKPNKRKISGQAKRFESNADLSDQVAGDPRGIGFTGIAYRRNAKVLSISSPCGIEKSPSVFSVKTEEYPLSRRLFLYTTDSLIAPHGRKLLQFALSDDAQDVVVDVGFIDQSIDRLSFAAQGDRLAKALDVDPGDFDLALMRTATSELSKGERLSTTFRFNFGSSELDNKALQDIGRLANLLKRAAYRDSQFLLVGFADSVGAFDKNRSLSLTRALKVQAALQISAGRDLPENKVVPLGLGELMPVACNETESGRALNRRVEVWIR